MPKLPTLMAQPVDTTVVDVASPGQIAAFAPAVVAWQARHGRHHLPWQRTRNPYHVWLSEIMLQQTQVATVLGYFERFLDQLPTVQALAAAPQAQVMALWAGLGYYSRARNLHACAQDVVQRFNGEFPSTAAALESLPGIGPSTAAAIASFCFGQPISIYDGNVKRVLSRLLAFDGDLSGSHANKQLQAQAQALVAGLGESPLHLAQSMPRYTQGLMDLGATVCHLKAPLCQQCPVHTLCEASKAGQPTNYPVKSKKIKRSSERWYLLLLERGDAVWLEQRGNTGIWGGLQAPLVFAELALACDWLVANGLGALGATPSTLAKLGQPSIKHQLTHKELFLTPVVLRVPPAPATECLLKYGNQHAQDQVLGAWVGKDQVLQAALPAPVKKWLQTQGY
ncbi:A/G-specific adenine glycosylase [Comamonadaceae bacterium M7527]|nr:A/G-specific adenine glycosylase [Comamonadaceae bacterium M7527]